MDRRRHTKLSKRLSYHLRHDPGAAGLELDPAGWTSVEDVVTNIGGLTRAALDEVVHQGDKQRFEFSQDGTRIRARYGHSVEVDPAHDRQAPPNVLYHGTAVDRVERIEREGIERMGRQQVHLSAEAADAEQVGRRHGRPAVLEVAAGRMHEDGFVFSRATQGVWLVDEVPPRYLSLRD